jgi:L-seryl-tRNA(Ser) seleniumtransferase
MNEQQEDGRQHIPSVDKVLQCLETRDAANGYSHNQKLDAARQALQNLRAGLPDIQIPNPEDIASQAIAILENKQNAGLRRVVNGAGILLHTGLGRAVLPKAAVDALSSQDYCCNIQVDLSKGTRGKRDAVVESLICTLTGAEAATIVNNNAAATLLALAALCGGKELIVSRGQLIEIGGSFRLPDVIAQSGTCMVEVGTTNKTHLRDYENAITDDTAVLLRVNPSNYRIVGFSKSVPTTDLVALAKERNLLVVDDLGCGALVDLKQFGLPSEPTVQDSIAAGADVALFSGDKLIGGPQAGIIVGKKDCIDRIRKHPLARALRVGKLTIAAMEATLKLFLNPDTLVENNPTLRMLALDMGKIRKRAKALAKRLTPYIECDVIDGESVCGGGAMPDSSLPSAVVALRHKTLSATELAYHLRQAEVPVITRIQDDAVCIDARTLLNGDEGCIETAVKQLPEAPE